MLEKSRRRLVAGGLVILAAVVFGAGIDWGLPSHAIDPVLFGVGPDSATLALNSYRLTGVGIERLAGDWDDNPNLPADAAAHPITDRSIPVTLLENVHGATADQLVQQGDRAMAALVAARDAADRRYAVVRLGNDDKAADRARDAAEAAQKKLHLALEDYNRKHFGDLDAASARDDASRARILRRYRLYSDQPDEMISFRALAKMHPGNFQFDPKLYQYGGLWIYPLGAIVKAASMVGYVTVTDDPTYYLDSPEVFGRFYILGRALSAMWGLVAVLAVFAIVRRVAGGLLLPALAAICFTCMPVVVNLAHEAKPHLAGTALMLLAVLAAGKYVQTGRWKWIIWTAVACGASAGMVLWGIAALAILPAMSVMRRDRAGRFAAVCIVGLLISAAIYFAANPYVAIHLAGDRAVLQSNFANTRAMYPGGGSGSRFVHAAVLVAAGMSWPLAILSALSAVVLVLRRSESIQRIGWLLAAPAAIVLIDFALFAANKPGEYARFAVFADTALMLAAFFALARFNGPSSLRAVAGVILVVLAAVHGAAYEHGFLRDSSSDDSRMRAAAEIDGRLTAASQNPILYVQSEPAPYCLPPVNLFRWRIILLPRGGE
ncbi:MAG: hypothetical protein ABSC42_08910, partial [Tepidisphaeraceae bacterium]